MFVNGTFSGIDGLTARMRAATAEELAQNPLDPQAASVIVVTIEHGASVSGDVIEAALQEHKPKWAAMAHWETGSGRINDLEGFSAACEKYNVLGLVDAVSSLGVGGVPDITSTLCFGIGFASLSTIYSSPRFLTLF